MGKEAFNHRLTLYCEQRVRPRPFHPPLIKHRSDFASMSQTCKFFSLCQRYTTDGFDLLQDWKQTEDGLLCPSCYDIQVKKMKLDMPRLWYKPARGDITCWENGCMAVRCKACGKLDFFLDMKGVRAHAWRRLGTEDLWYCRICATGHPQLFPDIWESKFGYALPRITSRYNKIGGGVLPDPWLKSP